MTDASTTTATTTSEEEVAPETVAGVPHKPNAPARTRNWCFRIDAEKPDPEDPDKCPYSAEAIQWMAPGAPCPIQWWMEQDKKEVSYLACQIEQGERNEQVVHIQGYLQVANPCSRVGLNKVFGQRVHFEQRWGTHDQAKRYVTKEKTRLNGPWEFGDEVPDQGTRTDLKQYADAVRVRAERGMPRQQCINEVVGECYLAANFVRQLDAWYDAYYRAPDYEREVRIYYVWGRASGAGKSNRTKWFYGRRACIIDTPYVEGKSFDKYNGQTVLVLDEWKPSKWDMNMMNTLLDPFEVTLNCRYRNKVSAWDTVIILTNRDPDGIYINNPDRHTFLRRIMGRIYNVESWEDPLPFIPAEDNARYLQRHAAWEAEHGAQLPVIPHSLNNNV